MKKTSKCLLFFVSAAISGIMLCSEEETIKKLAEGVSCSHAGFFQLETASSLKKALERGLDINEQDKNTGYTLLMFILDDFQFDYEVEESSGEWPSLKKRFFPKIQFLLSHHNINVVAIAEDGATALSIARGKLGELEGGGLYLEVASR